MFPGSKAKKIAEVKYWTEAASIETTFNLASPLNLDCDKILDKAGFDTE